MDGLKQYFGKLTALSLVLLSSACATTVGRQITFEEERRAQAILSAEAEAWHKKQEEKIQGIGARLLRVAENSKPLEFRFLARPEQTGGRINPDSVSAWTDGKSVWMTRGIIRFLKNEDEIAVVLAHEMAHAYRGHMRGRTAKQLLRLALGPGPGQILMMLVDAASVEFDRDKEREADLYGLIWTHNAGFNVDAAKEILKRMAIEMPESTKQGFLARHPTSAERLLAMEKVAEALKANLDPLKAFSPKEGESSAN